MTQEAIRIIQRNNANRLSKVHMTNRGKETIKEAIGALPTEDRNNVNKISFQVSEILMDRYDSARNEDNKNLDYQLKRLGMETIQDVRDQVSLYLRLVPAGA